MQHKYFYEGLQGAIQALHMLHAFPELKLYFHGLGETVEITSINFDLEVSKEREAIRKLSIEIDGFTVDTNIHVLGRQFADCMKIIVPPEMEGFFGVFQIGDTFQGYSGTIVNVKEDCPAETLAEWQKYYEGHNILSRRGIDFHTPEGSI